MASPEPAPLKKMISVEICLGSSCFARGNRELSEQLQEFIFTERLGTAVTLRGSHCKGLCREGPILEINGKTIKSASLNKSIERLREQINHDTKK